MTLTRKLATEDINHIYSDSTHQWYTYWMLGLWRQCPKAAGEPNQRP